MAEAGKDQDQSMEDILQSIKRIIAEEGDPAAEAASNDVLELTELLAEDGSVSKPTAAVEALSIEDIMAAPISSAPTKPAEADPFELAPAPTPIERPAPVAREEGDALLSGATLSASVAALNSLRNSLSPNAPQRSVDHMAFRSGITIEDLVLEGLRPLLKDWIDRNLPSLVETLVKKEISKLTQ